MSGEFKPGGSEAQNLSAITFAPGALGLSRDLTGGYSAALCLCIGMELLAAAIIMMRRRSTRSRRPVCADGSGDLNSLM